MSDDKIKELLAVSDLPEKEQWKKLRPFTDASGDDYERGLYSECLRKRVLADLAFRLRDKTGKTPDFNNSCMRAMHQIFSKRRIIKMEMDDTTVMLWWIWNARPIDWIIRSLIAKELAKDNGK